MYSRASLLLAAGAALTARSFACACAPPPPYRCQLPTAPLAFAGTVISKQPVDLRPRTRPQTAGNDTRLKPTTQDRAALRDDSYIEVIFQVTEPLRGNAAKTTAIRIYPANNSCSYPFEIGHDYLVFAYDRDGKLRTDVCAGTRPLETEVTLIQQLRAARAGLPIADVFGLTAPGATVLARSSARDFQVQASNDGSYEFRTLARDRYDLSMELPRLGKSPTRTVSVEPGSPCRVDFQVPY